MNSNQKNQDNENQIFTSNFDKLQKNITDNLPASAEIEEPKEETKAN